MQKSVKQFQIIMKLIIGAHLYLIYCALIPQIKSQETDETSGFVCKAAKQPQQHCFFKCIASDTSTTERSVLPIAFHEVIHFSSHTLTLNLSTYLMRGERKGDEVRD